MLIISTQIITLILRNHNLFIISFFSQMASALHIVANLRFALQRIASSYLPTIRDTGDSCNMGVRLCLPLRTAR